MLTSKLENPPKEEEALIFLIEYQITDTVIHEVIHTCNVSHDESISEIQDIDEGYQVSKHAYDLIVRNLISASF